MSLTPREFPVESNTIWETPSTPVTPHDFVFHNGMRLVKPYFFEFIAHVKERWNKKQIIDVFADEFRQRPPEYYAQAVKSGRIRVNGKMVTCTTVVRTSQTLSHFVHRHEPPVMAGAVEILEMDMDIVTVCKPASVPVHPCGQYRKNTVLGILEAEHGLGDLYPIHRLDRLVSGLLLLARNAATADRFRLEIESAAVTKVYVAKVLGVFPSDKVEVNAAVIYDAREGRSTVAEPIGLSMGGESLNNCKGKKACTTFRRMHTDGTHSIVECVPLTGRTHQIRVHLQHLGYPIANDALYMVDNPQKRTEMKTSADRAAWKFNTACSGSGLIFCKKRKSNQDYKLSDTSSDKHERLNKHTDDTSPDTSLRAGEGVEFVVDPMCTHCPCLSPAGYEIEEHALWLHCKSYSGEGWKYECPLPSWAALPS